MRARKILSGPWLRPVVLSASLIAGTTAAAPAPLHDAFLSHLVGRWQLQGIVLKKPIRQIVTGSWAIRHQFVVLHFTGSYEAAVYIGYDAPHRSYVEHWLDEFGGAGATAAGIGTRNGNAVTFLFHYTDGDFRNTMTYDPRRGQWRIHYASLKKDGTWSNFGDQTLTPM